MLRTRNHEDSFIEAYADFLTNNFRYLIIVYYDDLEEELKNTWKSELCIFTGRLAEAKAVGEIRSKVVEAYARREEDHSAHAGVTSDHRSQGRPTRIVVSGGNNLAKKEVEDHFGNKSHRSHYFTPGPPLSHLLPAAMFGEMTDCQKHNSTTAYQGKHLACASCRLFYNIMDMLNTARAEAGDLASPMLDIRLLHRAFHEGFKLAGYNYFSYHAHGKIYLSKILLVDSSPATVTYTGTLSDTMKGSTQADSPANRPGASPSTSTPHCMYQSP